PVPMTEAANKIVRTSREIFSELGREPTPEELAKKLHMPPEKVRHILKINKEPLSLETPIGEEGDSHLGDLIEDQNTIQPIDAMIQSHLRETTSRALASLTPPRRAHCTDAVRTWHEQRPHAGGSGTTVFSHARTNSSDRSQGVAET